MLLGVIIDVPCTAKTEVKRRAVRSRLCASSYSIPIAIAFMTQKGASFLDLISQNHHTLQCLILNQYLISALRRSTWIKNHSHGSLFQLSRVAFALDSLCHSLVVLVRPMLHLPPIRRPLPHIANDVVQPQRVLCGERVHRSHELITIQGGVL